LVAGLRKIRRQLKRVQGHDEKVSHVQKQKGCDSKTFHISDYQQV
jgi:hypothetical protein